MIRIDMQMPDCCSECRFKTGRGFCKAMPDNFCGYIIDYERPEWCPLKEQEAKPVLSERKSETMPFRHERKGFCPTCHQVISWTLNRSFCGFCGQAVNWE